MIFPERGSETYFLQLATFTVIMTHSMLICQSFFAVKTGCFGFHRWLITHGPISHHYLEKAQLYHILQKRSSCSLLTVCDVDR